MKPPVQLSLLFMLSAVLFLPGGFGTGPAFAQDPPPAARRALSIGFLREGSDFADAEILMERLRRFIVARPGLMGEMAEAGFAPEFELSPCDGPRDMEQRMNLTEFDLVFATAVVYARQSGDYGEPILMSFLPGDRKQPNEVGVLRRGVVIAGRGSPLFKQSNPTEDQIRAALAVQPLAVASSDSAAGYIFPTLYLNTKLGLARPGEYWFCGSDAEVVKHVVSGLAPMGACREGELQALLPRATDGSHYRILFRTDYFPTDPIVLRSALAPDRSPLGAELKLALREFFKQSGEATGQLTVENASGRSFESLRSALRQIAGRRPQASPAPMPVPVDQFGPTTGTLTIVPVMPSATPRTAPAMPPGMGGPR